MRRLGVISCIFFVLGSACATTSTTPGVTSSLDVDVRVEQLPDTGFSVRDHDAVSIAYQLTVRNRSAMAITLRRIEMQAAARSPYRLRPEPVTVSETIEPGQEAVVAFTMWSYAKEPPTAVRRMVWLSGVATFETPKGMATRSFVRSFREP